MGGVGGVGALPDFLFCSFFPAQKTTSRLGHRVQVVFRVGNQYAECEKQQQFSFNNSHPRSEKSMIFDTNTSHETDA